MQALTGCEADRTALEWFRTYRARDLNATSPPATSSFLRPGAMSRDTACFEDTPTWRPG